MSIFEIDFEVLFIYFEGFIILIIFILYMYCFCPVFVIANIFAKCWFGHPIWRRFSGCRNSQGRYGFQMDFCTTPDPAYST